MAKKTSRRRSAKSSSTMSSIKRRLRDAQTVFANYFESGGKRVKETFDALVDIFESRHLNNALRVASVRSAASTRTASRRRTSAAHAKSLARRTGGAAKSGPSSRAPKRASRKTS